MTRKPAYQFYPGDWRRDLDLQTCSLAARGLWIELLNLLHYGTPRGYLRGVNGKKISMPGLAKLVGTDLAELNKLLGELNAAGVGGVMDGVIDSPRMLREQEQREARRLRARHAYYLQRKLPAEPEPPPEQVEARQKPPPNQPEKSISSDGWPDGFSRFWADYPAQKRNENFRGLVGTLWANQRCEAESEAILTGLEAWKKTQNWQKENGKYIASMRSFIDQKLWAAVPKVAEMEI